jgi:hypothetical protein
MPVVRSVIRATRHRPFPGTQDDKIKLSQRMHDTLEAMAQALCRLWFLDFDPIRRPKVAT